MSERAGCDGGSARRRRDRQLRAWHRRVRTTVAMELATALHHSAQQVEGPREEAGHETHNTPRGPKTLPPGKRPAPLAEVSGPQLGGSHGRQRGCPSVAGKRPSSPR